MNTNTPWTRELVADRIRSAWDTLRRMPEQCFPSDTMTAWPEVVRDWREAYGYTEERMKLAKPSPAAIDRMYETIGWFALIVEQQNRNNLHPEIHRRIVKNQSRAVWLCCGCGMGAKRASDIMRAAKQSVRGWRDEGLEAILRRLNAKEHLTVTQICPTLPRKSLQVGQSRPRTRRAFSGVTQ